MAAPRRAAGDSRVTVGTGRQWLETVHAEEALHHADTSGALPAYPTLVALLAGCSLATGAWPPFGRALVAGVVLFVVYLNFALLPGGGIGFGDVKLAGLLGLLLGWLSWAQVWWATLATFLIGGVVAVALLALRRKGARDEFAYGPAMLLGAVGALASPAIIALVAR